MPDMTLLDRLAEVVPKADGMDSLVPTLLELLGAVTGLESTYLTSVDAERGVQTVLFANNQSGTRMRITEGLETPWDDTLCKRALDEGQAICERVEEKWGDSRAVRELGIHTYLSQAVRIGEGDLYGTLCAASPREATVPPEAVRVLALFSHLIGRQIDHEQLVDQLRRENREYGQFALTDPLTGIANRRALDRELERALATAHRRGGLLHLGFIDLDGFKAINDDYGHDAGDRFLIVIAGLLKQGLREGDFIARYGGDEFVVFGEATAGDPEAGRRELHNRLERLTRGHFEVAGTSLDYAGASVGVINSQPGDRDVRALLARADEAMYREKTRRRGDR